MFLLLSLIFMPLKYMELNRDEQEDDEDDLEI